ALEDVREREEAEAGVGTGEWNRRTRGLDVRVQVVVCEHHALRLARRARRVDDRRQSVRAYGARTIAIARFARRIVEARAIRLEVGQSHVGAAAAVAEGDDVSERRP